MTEQISERGKAIRAGQLRAKREREKAERERVKLARGRKNLALANGKNGHPAEGFARLAALAAILEALAALQPNERRSVLEAVLRLLP